MENAILLNQLPSQVYRLTVENLQCIRDDRVLFENFNFSLENGQLLQIEGKNGSGKTSLLRILCGLSMPTEGRVLWQDQDILDDKSYFWSHLHYIGHAPGIKVDLTPLENLAMSQALQDAPTTLPLETALNYVGLYGFEDVPTRTLSAGQQRRVALARLLLNDARLWILDEPFTALDKSAIQWVEHVLDAHAQRGGMAILTSHHPINCQYASVLHLGMR